MPSGPRIVIGGVPFGRNNVGDEGILDCQVQIVRELRPDARVVVCTDEPETTAARLSVETAPLVGFDTGSTPNAPPGPVLDGADLWLWGGATGFSDYPDVTLRILAEALERDLPTAVFGTGMNHCLNPAHYRLHSGPRYLLYRNLDRLTLGAFHIVAGYEHRKQWRTRRRLAELLDRVACLVVRDEQTQSELRRSGVTREIVVGADPAILVSPAPPASVSWAAPVRHVLAGSRRKLGVCISAQSRVQETAGLVATLDRLVEEVDLDILFVPMNPLTDACLMADLRRRLRCPERAVVVEGSYDAPAIAGLAARLDVVVSSRLHLLILATNSHVPVVGIGRGSKIANFVGQYGLRPAGTVDEPDFGALDAEVRRWLRERDSFESVSRRVRTAMLTRLTTGKTALGELLVSL